MATSRRRVIPAVMPLEGKVLLSAIARPTAPAPAVVIEGGTPHPHLLLNGTLSGGFMSQGAAIQLTSVAGNLVSTGRMVATGTLTYSASDRTISGVIVLSNSKGSLSVSIIPHGPTTGNGQSRVAFTVVSGTGAYAGVANHGSGRVTVSTANTRFTATLTTLH